MCDRIKRNRKEQRDLERYKPLLHDKTVTGLGVFSCRRREWEKKSSYFHKTSTSPMLQTHLVGTKQIWVGARETQKAGTVLGICRYSLSNHAKCSARWSAKVLMQTQKAFLPLWPPVFQQLMKGFPELEADFLSLGIWKSFKLSLNCLWGFVCSLLWFYIWNTTAKSF